MGKTSINCIGWTLKRCMFLILLLKNDGFERKAFHLKILLSKVIPNTTVFYVSIQASQLPPLHFPFPLYASHPFYQKTLIKTSHQILKATFANGCLTPKKQNTKFNKHQLQLQISIFFFSIFNITNGFCITPSYVQKDWRSKM